MLEEVPLQDRLSLAEKDFSDQGREFYGILRSIYSLADDTAYASAFLDLELSEAKLQEQGEENAEIPDDFDQEWFRNMYVRLLKIVAVKKFAEKFGLDNYLPDIMRSFIPFVFGRSQTGSVSPASVFYGTDEEFLMHQIKERIKQRRS